MPRAPWDSTIHDLSVHRVSRQELALRRQRLTSPNALAARQDLERRRALLARGSFEQTLAALAGSAGEASTALRELDEVQVELKRLADDAQGPNPVAVPPIDVAAASAAPSTDCGADRECGTPETPVYGLQLDPKRDAPWTAHSIGEEAAAESRGLVVDLDEEISLFRQRAEQRLVAMGGGAVAAADTPAVPHTSVTEMASALTPSSSEDRKSPAVPRSSRKTAAPAPWRPAMGRASLTSTSSPVRPKGPHARRAGGVAVSSAPASASSACTGRAPDALGLARLQRKVAELTQVVRSYEELRGPTGSSPASGEDSAGLLVEGGAAADGTTYAHCSTQLVQLAMCLTRHLKHVEGELAKAKERNSEQERAQAELNAEMGRQADLAEAEQASMRREMRLLKEEHGIQIAALNAELDALRTKLSEAQSPENNADAKSKDQDAFTATTPQLASVAHAVAARIADGPFPDPVANLDDMRGSGGGRLVPSLLTPISSVNADALASVTPPAAPRASRFGAAVQKDVRLAVATLEAAHAQRDASEVIEAAEAAEVEEGAEATERSAKQEALLSAWEAAWREENDQREQDSNSSGGTDVTADPRADFNARLAAAHAALPAAWAERHSLPSPSTGLRNDALPSSALPDVVRWSPPSAARAASALRADAASESGSMARAPASMAQTRLRGAAPQRVMRNPASVVVTSKECSGASSATSSVASSNLDNTASGETDEAPSWHPDDDHVSNDERSQQVLQRYYDELAGKASCGGSRPVAQQPQNRAKSTAQASEQGNGAAKQRAFGGAASANTTTLASRRLPRVARASIEPTQLFGEYIEASKDEQRPCRVLPTALA